MGSIGEVRARGALLPGSKMAHDDGMTDTDHIILDNRGDWPDDLLDAMRQPTWVAYNFRRVSFVRIRANGEYTGAGRSLDANDTIATFTPDDGVTIFAVVLRTGDV